MPTHAWYYKPPPQLGMRNETNGVPGFEGRANTHKSGVAILNSCSIGHRLHQLGVIAFGLGVYATSINKPSTDKNDNSLYAQPSCVMTKHPSIPQTQWSGGEMGLGKSSPNSYGLFTFFYLCPDSCLCSVILSLFFIWDSTSEDPLSSVQVLKYSLTASITCRNSDSSSRPWHHPAKQLLLHYCHQPVWHRNPAMSHVCLLSATNSSSSRCSLVFELQRSTSPCDRLHYHSFGWESEEMRNFGVGS